MAQTAATDAQAITATPGRAKTSDKIIPMAAANARPRNGWRGAVGNFIDPQANVSKRGNRYSGNSTTCLFASCNGAQTWRRAANLREHRAGSLLVLDSLPRHYR